VQTRSTPRRRPVQLDRYQRWNIAHLSGCDGLTRLMLETQKQWPARQRVLGASGSVTRARRATMKSKGMLRLPLPLLSVVLGGCFSYVALSGAVPARGRDVVARLSPPLAVPLQDVTVREVTLATGKVAYADADSIVLTAQRFTSDAGSDYPGLGTSVTIPRSQIAQLEAPHVSQPRTALVLAGGVAALVAIVASVGALLGSSSGAPPPP